MTDRLTHLDRDLDATRALLERDGRKVLVVAVILDGSTGTIAHSVSPDTTRGDGLSRGFRERRPGADRRRHGHRARWLD